MFVLLKDIDSITIQIMIDRILKSKSYIFYEAADNNFPDISPHSEYSFVKLTYEDLQGTTMCNDNARLVKFQKLLEDGHLCFGHKENETGVVCSYFWVSDSETITNAPFAFQHALKLRPNVVYVSDCRVDDNYRGQGLYTSGLVELRKCYLGKHSLITAERKNIISHKGISKAGYKIVSDLSLIQFCSHVFITNKNRLKHLAGFYKN